METRHKGKYRKNANKQKVSIIFHNDSHNLENKMHSHKVDHRARWIQRKYKTGNVTEIDIETAKNKNETGKKLLELEKKMKTMERERERG